MGGSTMELKRYLSGLGMFVALAISHSSPDVALVTHYDASALPPVTDGTQVLTLTDISGHGKDAKKSSTAAMGVTYVPGGIGGKAVSAIHAR
jgi:hypothetical protein